jgi:hypothetical protein
MGSPASIRFWADNEDEHPLGLYLCRGTASFAATLADALALSKDRWDDPEYATRIAIQSILEDLYIDAEDNGAGLYVGTADHGGPVLNVNWGSKTVWTDRWRLSFQQYMNNNDEVWEEVQA